MIESRYSLVPLGEVSVLDLDKVPVEPTQNYKMVGVYSYGKGLFKKESVDGSNTSYKHFNRLHGHHVIMSQLFGWEGALALCKPEFVGDFVSPQFPTFTCDTKKLDRKYLGWIFRFPKIWADLGTRTKGMGDRRRTLNPDAFFAVQIPLPPLDEQRRIVEQIEHLAAKVEEAKKLVSSSSGKQDILLLSAIESFSKGDENGWDKTTVKEVIQNIDAGWSPQCENFPAKDNQWGVLKTTSVQWCEFRFNENKALPPSLDAKQELAAKKGDVLVTRAGPKKRVGVAAAVLEDHPNLMISDKLIRLRCNPDLIEPEYLALALSAHEAQKHFFHRKTGLADAQVNISQGILKSTPLGLPRLDEQREIIGRFNLLRERISALSKEAQKREKELEALLPSILDKAFRGELNIAETERRPAKVVSIQRENTASEAFQEAVLIARLVRDFASDEYLLSRKRYTKLAYLFHRKSKDDVKRRYLKKAAGPYSPWTKYQGPEKIALTNKYIQEGKKEKYSGFKPGPEIDQIDRYFAMYWDEGNIAWLIERFKYKSTDNLEVLATVDMAMLDLVDQGRVVSLETVKDVIASEPEWVPKLSREVFSDAAIAEAIRDLQGWFMYA